MRLSVWSPGRRHYIKKPFSLAVLKVRIQTALRKHQGGEREKTLYCGDLTLDPQRVKVFKGTGEIGLTTQEFRLLKYFMENRERVLLKEQIMDILWDQKGNFVEENTLPVTISRLRKKIEDDPVNPFYIKTVHGMGYLFHGGKRMNGGLSIRDLTTPSSGRGYSPGRVQKKTGEVLYKNRKSSAGHPEPEKRRLQ